MRRNRPRRRRTDETESLGVADACRSLRITSRTPPDDLWGTVMLDDRRGLPVRMTGRWYRRLRFTRWYFACPFCRRRVTRLYSRPEDARDRDVRGLSHACRRCAKLVYRSQYAPEQV